MEKSTYPVLSIKEKNLIKQIGSITEISRPNETKAAANFLIFREPANLIDQVSTGNTFKQKEKEVN